MGNRELALLKYVGRADLFEKIKFCPDCNAYIDIDLFYNNKSRKDGKATHCIIHLGIRKEKSEERLCQKNMK